MLLYTIKRYWDNVFNYANKVLVQQAVYRCGRGVSIHKSVCIEKPKKIVLGNSVKLCKGVTIRSRSLTKAPSVVFGNGVVIHDNTYIDDYGGKIVIGDGSGIGQMCVIAGHGGLRIGSNCMIAGLTYIIPANHSFTDPRVPYVHQKETREGIVIGDNVWIGAGCIVLDGVKIGSNTVIGAGSVVTKDIPCGVVACGNPAKVIRVISGK